MRRQCVSDHLAWRRHVYAKARTWQASLQKDDLVLVDRLRFLVLGPAEGINGKRIARFVPAICGRNEHPAVCEMSVHAFEVVAGTVADFLNGGQIKLGHADSLA